MTEAKLIVAEALQEQNDARRADQVDNVRHLIKEIGRLIEQGKVIDLQIKSHQKILREMEVADDIQIEEIIGADEALGS